MQNKIISYILKKWNWEIFSINEYINFDISNSNKKFSCLIFDFLPLNVSNENELVAIHKWIIENKFKNWIKIFEILEEIVLNYYIKLLNNSKASKDIKNIFILKIEKIKIFFNNLKKDIKKEKEIYIFIKHVLNFSTIKFNFIKDINNNSIKQPLIIINFNWWKEFKKDNQKTLINNSYIKELEYLTLWKIKYINEEEQNWITVNNELYKINSNYPIIYNFNIKNLNLFLYSDFFYKWQWILTQRFQYTYLFYNILYFFKENKKINFGTARKYIKSKFDFFNIDYITKNDKWKNIILTIQETYKEELDRFLNKYLKFAYIEEWEQNNVFNILLDFNILNIFENKEVKQFIIKQIKDINEKTNNNIWYKNNNYENDFIYLTTEEWEEIKNILVDIFKNDKDFAKKLIEKIVISIASEIKNNFKKTFWIFKKFNFKNKKYINSFQYKIYWDKWVLNLDNIWLRHLLEIENSDWNKKIVEEIKQKIIKEWIWENEINFTRNAFLDFWYLWYTTIIKWIFYSIFWIKEYKQYFNEKLQEHIEEINTEWYEKKLWVKKIEKILSLDKWNFNKWELLENHWKIEDIISFVLINE